MIAFVLAAAAVAAPPPATLEEGCDPQKLQQLLAMPRESENLNLMELDRRFAATLAEERKAEASATEERKSAESASESARRIGIALAALALVGLVLSAAAARRGSIALAVGAWTLVAIAGWFGHHVATARADAGAAVEKLTARQLALTQCRFRVADARQALMQSRISRCIHDLDEGVEDLSMWLGRPSLGKELVTEPEMRKLRDELAAAAK
jgi:hypothetical protein